MPRLYECRRITMYLVEAEDDAEALSELDKLLVQGKAEILDDKLDCRPVDPMDVNPLADAVLEEGGEQ